MHYPRVVVVMQIAGARDGAAKVVSLASPSRLSRLAVSSIAPGSLVRDANLRRLPPHRRRHRAVLSARRLRLRRARTLRGRRQHLCQHVEPPLPCQFVRPFSLRLHLVAAPRPHALLDRQFGEYGLRLQHGGIHRAAPTEYFTWHVRLRLLLRCERRHQRSALRRDRSNGGLVPPSIRSRINHGTAREWAAASAALTARMRATAQAAQSSTRDTPSPCPTPLAQGR